MTPDEYVKQAVTTESALLPLANEDKITNRILHAAIGISTEAGELLDVLKKRMFYGKTIDMVNVQEEMGDLFWYIAILCDAKNVSFEEVWQQNIEKLRVRYPGKFTEYDALNRRLNAERESLESLDHTSARKRSVLPSGTPTDLVPLGAVVVAVPDIIIDFGIWCRATYNLPFDGGSERWEATADFDQQTGKWGPTERTKF